MPIAKYEVEKNPLGGGLIVREHEMGAWIKYPDHMDYVKNLKDVYTGLTAEKESHKRQGAHQERYITYLCDLLEGADIEFNGIYEYLDGPDDEKKPIDSK